jgi:hypothetical protein
MLVSLPIVTGGNPLCSLSFDNNWPLSGQMSSYVQQCTAVHGAWGGGVVILGILAAGIAIRHYWKLHRIARTQAWSPNERRDAISYFGRLMLIGGAGLAFVLYIFSSSSALTPWYSARYLIGVVVAIPALISPLCQPIVFKNALSIVKEAVRVGLLLLIGLTFVKRMIDVWGMTPGLQQSFQQEDVLIQHLEQIGATRVYSNYWACYRLTFLSDERIICSVVGDQLQPGTNRYPPYTAIVNGDPHADYLFDLTTSDGVASDAAFQQRIALSGQYYERSLFGGYAIYQYVGAQSIAPVSHSSGR